MISSVNNAKPALPPFPLGQIEMEQLDDKSVHLKIPPQSDQEVPVSGERDPGGNIFGSFLYQTLNMLQRHKLMVLPGPLPIG